MKKKATPPKPEPDVPLDDVPPAPSRPFGPSDPSASSASFAQAQTEFGDETESVAPLRLFENSGQGAFNRWSMPGDGQSSSARSDLSEGERETADADYRRYASLRRGIQAAASTV
jgi:hypothetical protein